MPPRSKPTGADFVAEVKSHEGAPYVYGDNGPRAFDCSGLMQYSLHQIGILCPRTSEQQYTWVDIVSTPMAGDLVFFVGAELDPPPGHVGVVVGPGQMINAPYTGSFVQQTAFSENGTGVNAFMGYGRVPGLSYAGSSNSSVYQPGERTNQKNTTQAAEAIEGIFAYLGVGLLLLAAIAAAGVVIYLSLRR